MEAWDFSVYRKMFAERGQHAGELPVLGCVVAQERKAEEPEEQVYEDWPEEPKEPKPLGRLVKILSAQGGVASATATMFGLMPGLLGFAVFAACALTFMACDIGWGMA